MTGKYESQGVLIGQPFVRDEKQRPVPFDATQHQGKEPKTYQLTENAEFNVAIRVAKDYDTQRQEQSATLGELIGANPALMTWFGDLFFENQDGPGHKDMAKRAKVMLDPKILATLNQEAGGTPPEVQAQLQQLQQQLQEAQQFIQTKQAEQQGAVQKAQLDNQTKERIAQAESQRDVALAQLAADASLKKAAMDNQTKITLEEMKLRGQAMQSEIDAQEAALGRESGIQQSREAAAVQSSESEAGRQHEQQMAERAAAQAAQAPNGEGA
jgi:hypothetical protein